ncbi:Cell wall alpha-1,3-glucan synthase ags1 [Ceratobasidium sp. 395]|nr:Cell wall alpha-1,3-glucan synthase ags1 [Ceratobasidium sp. 395]
MPVTPVLMPESALTCAFTYGLVTVLLSLVAAVSLALGLYSDFGTKHELILFDDGINVTCNAPTANCRTKEQMEVCSALGVSKEVCMKYVQFGDMFNLLHAAAPYISLHQKSAGVASVSDKYGKHSWARYPALWTSKHVDSLPDPDPSDIAALDEQPVDLAHIKIDQAAEAQCPELKGRAHEWARIKQDPKADLFVLVGRWSKQKGVDVIADVTPSPLEKKPPIQLILVGLKLMNDICLLTSTHTYTHEKYHT